MLLIQLLMKPPFSTISLNSVSCFLCNARSVVNKLDELHQLLYSGGHDIVFVTESWLHSGVTDGLLDPDCKFRIFRKDRTNSRGGGVCVFIKNCWQALPVTLTTEFIDLEILCFDLLAFSSRVRFFVTYRPPSYDSTAIHYLCNVIKCVSSHESENHTNVILGDLNLPKINWSSLSSINDILHKQFLSFIVESGYCQLVDFATHNENILDIVLTTDMHLFSYVKPDIPFGTSDHTSVKFTMIFNNDSNSLQKMISHIASIIGVLLILRLLKLI